MLPTSEGGLRMSQYVPKCNRFLLVVTTIFTEIITLSEFGWKFSPRQQEEEVFLISEGRGTRSNCCVSCPERESLQYVGVVQSWAVFTASVNKS